jgi:hypothetical protein
MSHRENLLLACIGLLTATAGVWLALDGERKQGRHQEQFQTLVGGIGFGPAVAIAEWDFAFDPRLAATCAQDLAPIPGGACFWPYHGCTVLEAAPGVADACMQDDGGGPRESRPDAPGS